MVSKRILKQKINFFRTFKLFRILTQDYHFSRKWPFSKNGYVPAKFVFENFCFCKTRLEMV